MTASETAKKRGFKSLEQVARMFNTTTQTMRNYYKFEPLKFEIILNGCLLKIRDGE